MRAGDWTATASPDGVCSSPGYRAEETAPARIVRRLNEGRSPQLNRRALHLLPPSRVPGEEWAKRANNLRQRPALLAPDHGYGTLGESSKVGSAAAMGFVQRAKRRSALAGRERVL
jgi:hypothetical protein